MMHTFNYICKGHTVAPTGLNIYIYLMNAILSVRFFSVAHLHSVPQSHGDTMCNGAPQTTRIYI